ERPVHQNLPIQLSSFIGRASEIAEVKRLLQATRLVTMTGVGGIGKTRLALEVAADLLDAYPEGVWLVELAALADPEQVPRAVARVLGIREDASRPLPELLADRLGGRRMLLLL